MEFVSILDLEEVPEREGGRPAFYLDFNLNQIIERISALWERNVCSYYYYLSANKACEDYRRDVFTDIKSGDTYKILCRFVKRMQEREEACIKGAAVRSSLQKAVWFIRQSAVYCDAFSKLAQSLNEIPLKSQGMIAFRSFLNDYLNSEDFKGLYETVRKLQEEMNSLKLILTYENDRITVAAAPDATKAAGTSTAEPPVTGTYDQFLQRSFPGQNRKMKTPFEVAADLSELEIELIKIVQKQKPGFFKETEKFYKKFEDYASEALLRFSKEIEFYLSFCCFELHMRENGFDFAAPARTETGEMSAYGLYDLALACAVAKHGTIHAKPAANVNTAANAQERIKASEKVISNDMAFHEGEQFFVLTGPNQGGKTTFARSLGQLVYFAKMGLDVPAKSAVVPYFGEILTHFSVEESVETGRGKLKEELVRLAPMMDAYCSNAFVVINELFTTAANYDACIMGKRVLEHFLAQNCYGIYVTHLKELAESGQGIVSLRATLDENGVQSFKIMRSAAEESASAINQVNKYKLTYEQLRIRLSGFAGERDFR